MFKALSKWASEAGVAVSDRYRSPLWTSFIISWVVLNWEILLVLLFPESAGHLDLMTFISTYLELNYWGSVLLWPLFIAISYSILGGVVRTWFETIALVLKGQAENSKSKFMRGRTAPWEYYEQLIEENRRLKSKENDEFSKTVEMSSKIESLQATVSNLTGENNKLKGDFDKVTETNTKLMQEINDLQELKRTYDMVLQDSYYVISGYIGESEDRNAHDKNPLSDFADSSKKKEELNEVLEKLFLILPNDKLSKKDKFNSLKNHLNYKKE